MSLWGKIFRKKAPDAVQTATAPETAATPPSSGGMRSAADDTSAPSEAEKQQHIARMLWEVKRPRYAHMAKHHEVHGELTEADYYYNMLVEAQSQTLGATHPDVATVLYELGRLNFHHDVVHTPEVQAIYNSLGRGTQVYMFYKTALEIRQTTLGEDHPTYAQSLYGLATLYKGNENTQEACAMLNQALKIQVAAPDPLPAALTTLCLADITGARDELAETIQLCQDGLQLLALPSASLATLDAAASYCTEAGINVGNSAAAWELIQKARSLQSSLADPYFEMTFRLLETGDVQLMSLVLELHRQQYSREFRAARLDALQRLADVYRKSGKPADAIPLLQEAAAMQQGER